MDKDKNENIVLKRLASYLASQKRRPSGVIGMIDMTKKRPVIVGLGGQSLIHQEDIQ